MRVTVIGTGYLGAVHAAGMAALGHEVLGVDVDPARIASLARGDAPFFEPGLNELLARFVRTGSLRFSTSLEEAANFGDVHFICVGTPQVPGSDEADLRFVDSAVTGLARSISRPSLIVGKSTVPVGTARRLSGLVSELAPVGKRIAVAWNPEFLREGRAVRDTLEPDRLVFGIADDESGATLFEVFRPLIERGTEVFTTDLETSELVKVAANSFLAMKISFINAMAEVCEAAGADIVTLADAIGRDERIGRRFLDAGVGFGGGCLGKDIRAFRARGESLGVGEALRFLSAADDVNDRRRRKVVDLAWTLLDGHEATSRVTVLGAAFKPNSDDVRDSPALYVARELRARGVHVTVHDPAAIHNAKAIAPELDFTEDLAAAVSDADLLVLLTEWSDYREVDPNLLALRVAARVVIDGRNVLDRARWNAAGWTVHSLGRPVAAASSAAATATSGVPAAPVGATALI